MRGLPNDRTGRGLSARSDLLSRFENFFEDFERGYFGQERSLADREPEMAVDFSPAVDIEESENMFMISVDLPGLKKDEIKIDVNKETLRIYGERRRAIKDEAKSYFERSHGRFVRNFTLPEAVDAENIEAHFEDGVLRIVLPKKEAAAPREVKIDVGSSKGLLDRFQIKDKKTERQAPAEKSERI